MNIKCLLFSLACFYASISCAQNESSSIQPRPQGQTDVIELRCEPIENVRIAVIGLGNRGIGAVGRLSVVPNASIVAVCDIQDRYVERAMKSLAKKNIIPDTYNKEDDWKRICERDDIDLIYVCTHWDLHTPIAVYAMQHGKHVAMEVPGALTLQECWDLVNTAEKYRRHCMMLENCNYDFFELATLNMAQQGLFGEIVHCEGAYIHDLRGEIFDSRSYWQDWRLEHNTNNIGNLYPTHGLGPIAHVMNIHRGDRMEFLVTVSTNQFGMTEFAKNKFGADSKEAKVDYKHGDMNTSLVRTVNGKTLMIQHDITSPRPYSRHHVISGTKGFAQKYPQEGLAFDPNAHSFMPKDEMNTMLQQYEHPIVSELGEWAKSVGGHGGMDFMMDYRLIYCLHKGLPLDMDVYDCAEWSSIVDLSKLSLQNGSKPIAVPDFTRGDWKKIKTVTYYK